MLKRERKLLLLILVVCATIVAIQSCADSLFPPTADDQVVIFAANRSKIEGCPLNTPNDAKTDHGLPIPNPESRVSNPESRFSSLESRI